MVSECFLIPVLKISEIADIIVMLILAVVLYWNIWHSLTKQWVPPSGISFYESFLPKLCLNGCRMSTAYCLFEVHVLCILAVAVAEILQVMCFLLFSLIYFWRFCSASSHDSLKNGTHWNTIVHFHSLKTSFNLLSQKAIGQCCEFRYFWTFWAPCMTFLWMFLTDEAV